MTEESHARLFWYHEFCHTLKPGISTHFPKDRRILGKGDAIPSRIPFSLYGSIWVRFWFSLYGNIWVRLRMTRQANEFTKRKIVFESDFVDNPKSEHVENISSIMVSLLILR